MTSPPSGVRPKAKGSKRHDDAPKVVIVAGPDGPVVQGTVQVIVHGAASSAPAKRSVGSSQPVAGMPGPIAIALADYARRCQDLERMGLTRAHAEAEILLESRELGGVPEPGETINLTLWSRRLHIPRPVLEALVLLEYHSRPAPVPVTQPSPGQSSARGRREVPTSSAPGTPAPRATRHPKHGPKSR